MKLNFRTLRADEIECRIGMVKEGSGLTLLLYKDARCDMNLLDEVVGPMHWKREHSRNNANCIVSIWNDEIKEWVSKEDTGSESNTEAEKGLASDSFKRACVNWGIGRELYTAPFIWISADKCSLAGKKCYDKFTVAKIHYDENRTIDGLVIVNEKTNKIVFTLMPKEVNMARPKKGTEAGDKATKKWLKTMKKKYGGKEGVHKKMQEIGHIGGKNGKGPNYKGGFAANPALARIAGAKGGRISRRTGIKTGQGKGK